MKGMHGIIFSYEKKTGLRELIELIPEEDRTPEPLRTRRLEACRRCSFLNAGTCALCGCYVEHRASRRGARCPDVSDRWALLP